MLSILIVIGGGAWWAYGRELANLLQSSRNSDQPVLAEEAQPYLPLSVTFRPGAARTGLVAMLRNNAPSSLKLAVVIADPAPNPPTQIDLAIPIGRIVEMPVAAGQHIRFMNSRYPVWELDVPGS